MPEFIGLPLPSEDKILSHYPVSLDIPLPTENLSAAPSTHFTAETTSSSPPQAHVGQESALTIGSHTEHFVTASIPPRTFIKPIVPARKVPLLPPAELLNSQEPDSIGSAEQRMIALAILEALDKRGQEILGLKHLHDMNTTEAAAVLGISRKEAKALHQSALRRARLIARRLRMNPPDVLA